MRVHLEERPLEIRTIRTNIPDRHPNSTPWIVLPDVFLGCRSGHTLRSVLPDALVPHGPNVCAEIALSPRPTVRDRIPLGRASGGF